MAPTASLMTEKACATNGSFISASAVRRVTARPIAACFSDTARRFSLKAHAMPSSATTPNADCSCCILPHPSVRAVVPAKAGTHTRRPTLNGMMLAIMDSG